MASRERLSIAQVTPHPWGSGGEVSLFVERLSEELARRGHRVLIAAPSAERGAIKATRELIRAAREDPSSLLADGEPRVLAVGKSVALGSSRRQGPRSVPLDVNRTLETLFSMLALDVVHVHEPFPRSVASAALKHSRSLNVATFHSPAERVLSTQLVRRFVDLLFGRIDARTATSPATAALLKRFFSGTYRVLDGAPGAAGSGGAGDGAGWGRIADEVEEVYRRVRARRHDLDGDAALRRRLRARPVIYCDLHMHTDHSHDCATPIDVLLETAKDRGLGAIAITDHNEISGALEARERADGIKVIVAEEVKTAREGEVIGLFLEQKIPRGMSMAETIAEIRRQGGLVYVPHPFDRLHSVPDYEHLLKIVEQIDILEVFNPRVAFSAFNEEAERFAAKYRIIAGAGSDSHVAQGLGSVRIRLHDFDGPREFLEAMRDADIVRKHKNLVYVQALKFLQTSARPRPARRATSAKRARPVRGGLPRGRRRRGAGGRRPQGKS